ncbi:2-phosphosulfolactate phosphatase [Tyzzerella sp. OttesenSCG-928-J15]|nr:2-phosphosulfolactate phosphatase [Tyzzerella sp. OttesenSCG-928-J15]
MEIKLFMTADDSHGKIDNTYTAVAIDVLRATSVITTAISNGAAKIKAFMEIGEAFEYRKNNPGENILLCGERNRILIDGFDLSNSPLEYTPAVVSGKTLAITTTNGTKAIEYAKNAAALYIASFLNLSAVAETVEKSSRKLALVCAGTEGRFSLDDFVCAGKLISLISEKTACSLDDGAYLAREYYSSKKENIKELIQESASYKGVIKAGFEKDLEYCLKESVLNCVPVYKNGFIVK